MGVLVGLLWAKPRRALPRPTPWRLGHDQYFFQQAWSYGLTTDAQRRRAFPDGRRGAAIATPIDGIGISQTRPEVPIPNRDWLERLVRPWGTHNNLLLLTATKSKKETSPAANEKDNWNCRCSNLPKIPTAKQQWGKQRERNRANDHEEHCKHYGFDHDRCVWSSGLTIQARRLVMK